MGEKLRGIRHIELWLALLALAACVLLGGRFSSGQTTLEGRMERVLSRVAGAGRVNVVLRCDEDERVLGAVIVAEGAADWGVRLALEQAAQSLLGVEITQLDVLAMEGGSR